MINEEKLRSGFKELDVSVNALTAKLDLPNAPTEYKTLGTAIATKVREIKTDVFGDPGMRQG